MSADDDADEKSGSSFGSWLRSVFSGGDIFKKLFSFWGLGSGVDSSGSGSPPIEPYVAYDEIENANTSLQLKASPLEKARKALCDIEDGTFRYAAGKVTRNSATAIISSDLERGPEVVREWLQRAGLDSSALDPAKSAEANEAKIRDAPRLGHIARARRYFAAITSPGRHLEGVGQRLGGLSDDPADIAESVRNELEKASDGKSVDFSALDPTGAKSSAQIEQELHKRVVEGYIVNARREFYLLKSAGDDFAHEDNKAQEWLNKAKEAADTFGFARVDASVLDPALKASAAAVNRDILKAIENEHVEKASQVLYWSRHGGYGDPKDAAEGLRKELAAANKAALALGEKPVDASALDPEGGKYRAYADRDLAELASSFSLQASVERMSKERESADRAAAQNEAALAALIRPLNTPSSGGTAQIRRKE
jgi:hypothetical protein